MKKCVLLLPVMLLPFLASCNKQEKKDSLTYGTYIQTSINSLKELNNDELISKTRDEKEIFLLAVYQGEYSASCLCWSTFQNVVVNYINTYHENVYVYNAYNQNEELANLKIEKIEDSAPYLYVFNGETTIAKYTYKNNSHKAIFENVDAKAMYNAVHKVINEPTMYYIDESYLDSQIQGDKDLTVAFIRRGCGDCSYVIPKVIIPYINDNKPSKKLYLFDMQDYYELSKKEDATEEEKAQYQNLKNYYGLSEKGSPAYGYKNGVMPTIQSIKKGLIVDATVYFNDEVSKKEDGTYYLSDSYYSEERLENLNYLKGCQFETVLKGMSINEGVLENPNGGYYWSQEVANRYHTPILKAFLDYYLK